MTTVREVMTPYPTTVSADDTVQVVARLLAQQEIGSVIVVDEEDRPRGMITDRDLTVGVLAEGKDPGTRVEELLSGKQVVSVDIDDPLERAVEAMKQAAVRRLPVLEGERVVGIISQADLATQHREQSTGEMVAAISEAPDNTNRG